MWFFDKYSDCNRHAACKLKRTAINRTTIVVYYMFRSDYIAAGEIMNRVDSKLDCFSFVCIILACIGLDRK